MSHSNDARRLSGGEFAADERATGIDKVHRHLVQFYEDETALLDRVTAFLLAGLSVGDSIVVIATEAHGTAYRRELESRGIDIARAHAGRQLTFLDAHETLSKFMRNGEPEPALFEAALGAVFEEVSSASNGARLRAFGEMVDVLWKQGNRAAALRIEELWNDLQHRYSFELLCAYALASFYREPAALARVSATHTDVVPVDGAADGATESDPHATSLPPRYARRLAGEIARRQEVEHVLRESLQELRAKNRALEESHAALARDVASRRAAEEALRRSEHQLRVVTDALPSLVSYVDAHERYVFVSAAYERWFGRPAQGMVGRHLKEVLGAPAYAAIRVHVERALSGAPVSFEAEIPYPDGNTRFVEATYVPQAEGKEGFVALVNDVTDRKAFERFRSASMGRAERLSKITAAIADAVSAGEVFEALVDRVSEAIHADSAGLWLVSEDGRSAELVRALGYSETARRRIESVPLDASPSLPVVDAIRRTEAVWIRSQAELIERYPHLAGVVTTGREYRVSCLPLVTHGRVLGALGLTTHTACDSEDDEQNFLLLTARYAGQAVERLRLFEAERRSRAAADAASARLGVLSHASRVFMHADLDLESRLGDIVVELGAALSSAIGIALVGPDQMLHTVALHHPVPEARALLGDLAKTSPVKLGEGISGTVALTGESALIPAVHTDEMRRRSAPSYRPFLERFPVSAMIVTPLRARGQIIGTVMASRTRPGETYTPDDLRLLEELAERAGAAIDNARLHRGTRDAHRRAEQLYRFARAVVVADTIEAVFDAALAAIEAALGVERAAILAFDKEGIMRFVGWRNLSDAYRAAVEGHSPWAAGATAPEPVLVPDAKLDSAMAPYRSLFERERIGALAFIPLVTRGRLLGKFMLYYDEAHAFPAQEVETALSIANHLASVMARFSAVAKLEETLRANELFAAVLAHDLRNPLGAIKTAAQVLLMQNEGMNQPARRDGKPLGRILSSSDRMTRMIDQLLDFTRARTGVGIELRPRASNLGELCTDVLGEFELAHPDWKLDCEMAGDLGGSWDSDRLLQVISNLVANAGQHGAAGGRIAIRLDGSDPERVRLHVHNGGSIPESLLPALFDPFRARQGRGRSSGLGLGLFIVRELVRAHDGTVEVSSADADGTTFSVELPRHALPRAPRPEPWVRVRGPDAS